MTKTISSKQLASLMYNPIYKPNQVICGTGQTAIVTGWRPIKQVANLLEPHEYAVIGNLYSATRGINFLVRNLLANPHVIFVVAIGDTKQDQNSGSVKCLVDFFHRGFREGVSDTGKKCWVINSEVTGYIDIDIPENILEQLRRKFYCRVDAPLTIEYGIQQVKNIALALNWERKTSRDEQEVAVFRAIAGIALLEGEKLTIKDPKIYPYEEPQSTTLPGHRYAHRIEGKTIAETWVKIIHRIKTTGTIRPTGYDGQWQELIDLVAVVTDEPEDFYFPNPNYLPCSPEFLKEYIPQVVEDSPYQEGVKYTYGQRIRSWFGKDQVEQVINKLVADINSARAVINLWDVSADSGSDNPPCLNHIWVRIVENELSLTATFRSNDMGQAWVSNAFALRTLQSYIKNQINERGGLNLTLAPLITVSESAHLYDTFWEFADKLIVEEYPKLCIENYTDPVGNFIIEWTGSEIQITHTTPGSGEVVGCFAGRNYKKLIQDICDKCPGIQPKHAAYLSVELFKCWQLQELYEQDK